MSGRPSRKSAEIGLFRPHSAFFALLWRARRAPGKSRKRRKKAFFLRYPQICLNPHLLHPYFRHSKGGLFYLLGKHGNFRGEFRGESFGEKVSGRKFRNFVSNLRRPGDSQHESGQFTRIDSRESIRRKIPIFTTFKRLARIASLRPQICDSQALAPPKRDSQQLRWHFRRSAGRGDFRFIFFVSI